MMVTKICNRFSKRFNTCSAAFLFKYCFINDFLEFQLYVVTTKPYIESFRCTQPSNLNFYSQKTTLKADSQREGGRVCEKEKEKPPTKTSARCIVNGLKPSRLSRKNFTVLAFSSISRHNFGK